MNHTVALDNVAHGARGGRPVFQGFGPSTASSERRGLCIWLTQRKRGEQPQNGRAEPSAKPSRSGSRSAAIDFGGPAGQIAMMHRILVDEKKWIDEPRFLHALNFCMLLPGPEAQKLATYIGWLLHGVRGGLVAGILFVLPGALVMLGLSLLYALGRGVPLIDGALFGIKAAVLVIVVEALIRIGKRALKTGLLIALAGAGLRRHLLLRAAVPADRRRRGADRLSRGADVAGAARPVTARSRSSRRPPEPLAASRDRRGDRPRRSGGRRSRSPR